MVGKTQHGATLGAASLTTVTALEKIPSAARRMGVSISQFYRLAKRDGLRIIKVGERSSAVPQCDVDAWIQRRVGLYTEMAKSASGKGGAK